MFFQIWLWDGPQVGHEEVLLLKDSSCIQSSGCGAVQGWGTGGRQKVMAHRRTAALKGHVLFALDRVTGTQRTQHVSFETWVHSGISKMLPSTSKDTWKCRQAFCASTMGHIHTHTDQSPHLASCQACPKQLGAG